MIGNLEELARTNKLESEHWTEVGETFSDLPQMWQSRGNATSLWLEAGLKKRLSSSLVQVDFLAAQWARAQRSYPLTKSLTNMNKRRFQTSKFESYLPKDKMEFKYFNPVEGLFNLDRSADLLLHCSCTTW